MAEMAVNRGIEWILPSYLVISLVCLFIWCSLASLWRHFPHSCQDDDQCKHKLTALCLFYYMQNWGHWEFNVKLDEIESYAAAGTFLKLNESSQMKKFSPERYWKVAE